MKALSLVAVALPVLLAIAAYHQQEQLPPQLAGVVKVLETNGLEAWQQLSSRLTASVNLQQGVRGPAAPASESDDDEAAAPAAAGHAAAAVEEAAGASEQAATSRPASSEVSTASCTRTANLQLLDSQMMQLFRHSTL
jgi:hypothetical protein